MSFGASAYGQGAFSQLSGTGATTRLSAWNFCDPFDHILPLADNNVPALDRQHLWGLYIGIVAQIILFVPAITDHMGQRHITTRYMVRGVHLIMGILGGK